MVVDMVDSHHSMRPEMSLDSIGPSALGMDQNSSDSFLEVSDSLLGDPILVMGVAPQKDTVWPWFLA